uniref:Uncharacterized protein n=1 Tax=Rhizophora mucronata TaxID=61149 RepID=A0A2P2PKM7_RHIMU
MWTYLLGSIWTNITIEIIIIVQEAFSLFAILAVSFFLLVYITFSQKPKIILHFISCFLFFGLIYLHGYTYEAMKNIEAIFY